MKGTLHQYSGRLHRLFKDKNEVQIYDYVDVHVRMLGKMYNKRLSGYASIGYKVKGDSVGAEAIDIIFDKSKFLPVFSNDIVNAAREILIVSPFITKRRTLQLLTYLRVALGKKVRIFVVTRPVEEYKGRDKDTLKNTLDLLENAGIRIITKPNIHQKFAVMDQRLLWYGSINLLSFGGAEESIMRLDSPSIVSELIRSIDGYE
ncbi:phospholipase D-like domain-containing protein [Candidatus Contubernalis alkalaceticus]|uniref:phospholipase D-like domain-containing protein n=1 Tax=Candidatus Contubernalis alkaliaceticus TaxID=338645 RepID=UPI002A4E136C|nr:phospholipase D-like domain-containing protein [Candidatus Contubernalis alkalaceticus]